MLHNNIVAACLAALFLGCNSSSERSSSGLRETLIAVESEEFPLEVTQQGRLPDSANEIFYACVSRGLAGRFTAYRFSGSINDLLDFSTKEFQSFDPQIECERLDDVHLASYSPDLELFRESYGLDLSWAETPTRSKGTVFQPANHRFGPVILVDTTNETLYHFWSD